MKKKPARTKRKPVFEAMLNINSSPPKDTIAEARAAINDILSSASDTAAKVAALNAVVEMIKPSSHVSVQNCVFTGEAASATRSHCK